MDRRFCFYRVLAMLRCSQPQFQNCVAASITCLVLLCIVQLIQGVGHAAERVHSLDAEVATIRELIASHCLDCHSSNEPEAGLDLESLDASFNAIQSREFDSRGWEKILKRVSSRQMPPADADRPPELEIAAAVESLATVLESRASKFPQPGRTDTIRRLNRTEYQNAIRDLLAIDIDAHALLPPDESSQGFDNITVGELSPMLLSRYLSAGQKISRLAIGGTQRSPGGETIRLPADRTQEKHVEGLPLGTRGGTLFRHTFPQDGEYEISLRLTRDRDEKVEGLDSRHQIDVLLDRARVHQFTIKPPPGGKDYTHVDTHLQTKIQVSAGPHDIGVTFPNQSNSLLEIKRQPFDAAYNRHRHPRITPALFQVSIVGPLEPQGTGATPSRLAIFASDPQVGTETHRAQAILSSLMRRAYRRPINDADLESPLWFFTEGLREGGFDAGIESALTSILVNPNFLFRIEREPAQLDGQTAYKLNPYELASRLSFFLWSSLPDDQLLSLAEADKLRDPAVIRAQVERMLADPRAHSLVGNFAAQWLYLRNLDSITPDLRLFPDFDDNLRQAFRQETELLFWDVVRHDQSVLNLIQSDTTYLNERLAKHYDIPHVFGSEFRPVKLTADSHRGGILRHGSILTVTSYATRTSPTIRGNWILQNIIGSPPPPPPPNVPNLKDEVTSVATSMRERLAQHRADPACASCHNLMDPIGFSLENYDALGRWRDFEESLPIDSSGSLPDGSQANSVSDLEAGIVRRPEMFVTTLTEKLMTFALGRGTEAYDGPAIRKIVASAGADEYKFSSLIFGIATSEPFQLRSFE